MPGFWAGTDESLDIVNVATLKVAEGQAKGMYMGMPSEGDMPALWHKEGNVGVVHVHGSLVNGSAGWMRLFGVSGYNDVHSAAVAAASDPEVKALMFHVSSGGGHVHGLAEFAGKINAISKTKPSLTYTPDTMASAAYWTGSAVHGPIVAAPTAEVGSLGVLQVHMERSKALLDAGVGVTVMRSGDLKAGMNPLEPLSDAAKEHNQSQLADLHTMFKKHVATRRPMMSADQLKEATRGQTFLGKRAIDIGLADSLGTHDQALKLLDKSATKKDTSSNSKGAAMFLTPEQLAQLAAGATLASLGIVITPEDQAAMDAAAATAKAASDAAAVKKAAEDLAAKEAADAAALKLAGTGGDVSAVALLQSQLATAQAAERAASQELVALKATTQTQASTFPGLLEIARGALANMLIPMGGNKDSAAAMDAATVVAEYPKTREQFLAKFPVGRQTQGPEVKDKAAEEFDPIFHHLAAQTAAKKAK